MIIHKSKNMQWLFCRQEQYRGYEWDCFFDQILSNRKAENSHNKLIFGHPHLQSANDAIILLHNYSDHPFCLMIFQTHTSLMNLRWADEPSMKLTSFVELFSLSVIICAFLTRS